jgi:hypothetical protein
VISNLLTSLIVTPETLTLSLVGGFSIPVQLEFRA